MISLAYNNHITAWKSCWNMVPDPEPGVVLAIPVNCRLPKSFLANLRGKTFVAPDCLYVVDWIGWKPSVGIVHATSEWISKRGKPQLPQEWSPFDGLRDYTEYYRKMDFGHITLISARGLPFPSWAGHDKNLTEKFAGDLLIRSLDLFLDSLPLGLVSCLNTINQRFRIHMDDEDWRYYGQSYLERNIDLCNLNLLLGCNSLNSNITAPQSGLRRRQFIDCHPLFATLLPDLRNQVDMGENTTQAISNEVGCNTRVVKALSRVPLEHVNSALDFMKTPWCVPLLEGMDPSWLPCLETLSDHGWQALKNLSRYLGSTTYYCNENMQSRIGGMSSPPVDNPSDGCFSMGRKLGRDLSPLNESLEWVAATVNLWAHINDVVEGMVNELALPAVARCDTVIRIDLLKPALKTALLSLGVRKISRVLTAHMAGQIHDARLGLAIESGSVGDSWGLAAPEVTAPGGLVLRFLSNQAELTAEGLAMNHCVGSYGQQCAQRTSLIMSMGSWSNDKIQEWKPSSTMEICLGRDANKPSVKVAQHYGFSNGRPCDLDLKSACWWLGEVKAERIVLGHACLKPRRQAEHDLFEILGEAWRTPAAHAHRWDRWRRLLDTRSTCFGDWLLSLPPVFLQSGGSAERLANIAVDMDTEMQIAHDIEVWDQQQTIMHDHNDMQSMP